MAGIGFQLRRILGKGDIGGTVGAIVSGIFIVAGPWLISVVSMALLPFAFSRFGFLETPVFQTTIVYCYAGSLSLFSGMHHHFTRIIADLVWEGRHGEATAWMLRFSALAVVASAAISIPVAAFSRVDVTGSCLLYRVAIVVLFAAVNIGWIVMLFISLLRDYHVINLVYGLGMAVSIVSALALSGRAGPGGAVLGYASGILLLDAVFMLVGVVRFPPVRPRNGMADFWRYARQYATLIASGFCFYAGQWLDKFYFWATRGTVVDGISARVYEAYDILVYMAGLSIIPGLVYFMIMTETQLYTDLRHFLFSLNHASWTKIQSAKLRMTASLRRELRDQSLLQAACSLVVALITVRLAPAGLARTELWLAFGSAFMQFTLLTLLVFLYYLELYGRAFAVGLLYFCVNGLGTVALYALMPDLPAGASHLAAGFLASIAGYALLCSSARRMDRIIFTRALRE